MTGPITTNYPPQPEASAPHLVQRQVVGLGWLPEHSDQRDQPFDHIAALRKVSRTLRYPSHIDLRPDMPPVYDQGQLGSCTANAIGGLFEYQQRRQKLIDYIPSRLFIYYGERELEGSINYDSGAMIRDGMKVINKLGAPDEMLWPYQTGQFAQRPSMASYADGLKHQALAYKYVQVNAPAVKMSLAAGYPVVIGFTVYQSFWNITGNGFMPIPQPTEAVEGGHAVLVVGYFKAKGNTGTARDWAICRNSWGSSWGDGGYFYMPMSWMCSNWNADDFWTITLNEG